MSCTDQRDSQMMRTILSSLGSAAPVASRALRAMKPQSWIANRIACSSGL